MAKSPSSSRVTYEQVRTTPRGSPTEEHGLCWKVSFPVFDWILGSGGSIWTRTEYMPSQTKEPAKEVLLLAQSLH